MSVRNLANDLFMMFYCCLVVLCGFQCLAAPEFHNIRDGSLGPREWLRLGIRLLSRTLLNSLEMSPWVRPNAPLRDTVAVPNTSILSRNGSC